MDCLMNKCVMAYFHVILQDCKMDVEHLHDMLCKHCSVRDVRALEVFTQHQKIAQSFGCSIALIV